MSLQAEIRDLLRAGLGSDDVRVELSARCDREQLNRTIAKARRDLGMTPRAKAAPSVEPVRCYPQPRWVAETRDVPPLPTKRIVMWDHTRPVPTFGDPAPDRNAIAQGYYPGSGLMAERRA